MAVRIASACARVVLSPPDVRRGHVASYNTPRPGLPVFSTVGTGAFPKVGLAAPGCLSNSPRVSGKGHVFLYLGLIPWGSNWLDGLAFPRGAMRRGTYVLLHGHLTLLGCTVVGTMIRQSRAECGRLAKAMHFRRECVVIRVPVRLERPQRRTAGAPRICRGSCYAWGWSLTGRALDVCDPISVHRNKSVRSERHIWGRLPHPAKVCCSKPLFLSRTHVFAVWQLPSSAPS